MYSKVSTPDQMLDGLFLEATSNHYTHFLMKTKKGTGLYQKPDLQIRIKEASNQLKTNCLTLQSDKGFTPAHVAVLSGNAAGLQFLTNNGASCREIKDDEGNTPLDLALKFRPELWHYLIDLSFLDNLFTNTHVKLPNSAFTYAASDDFGIHVKKLLFPKPTDQNTRTVTGLQNDHTAKNMISFGEKFGFEVVFSKNTYCLRDSLIKCIDKIYVPSDSKNISIAIDRNQSRSLYFSDSASFLTNHSFFRGKPGICTNKLLRLAHQDLVTYFGQAKELVPYLHFYMEGGNHYVMTNKLGKKIVLLGDDVLYTTLNQFRRDGVCKNRQSELDKYIPIFKEKLSLDAALLSKTLEEMYVQGLLVTGPGKEKGFVTEDEIFTTVLLSQLNEKSYLSNAQQQGYYKPLNLSELQKKNGIEIAAEYLVQKNSIKNFFPHAFGVDEVYFVPKLDYHLDVFLCPGPKGSIFVQDYSLTVKLLEQILDQKDLLSLTDLDLKHLKRFLETAQKLERELGGLNNKVKEGLDVAGLYVIPTPGLFYDVSPEDLTMPTFNLNFLNARTGWSPTTKSYYYLTTGASVGDKLGAVLMSTFEKFLKSYEPDIQVGFLGFDPDKVNDFSEGMRFLNTQGAQAGPHCFAFVMESSENTV